MRGECENGTHDVLVLALRRDGGDRHGLESSVEESGVSYARDSASLLGLNVGRAKEYATGGERTAIAGERPPWGRLSRPAANADRSSPGRP